MWIRVILWTAIALSSYSLLNTKFGHFPPLGKFLSPFQGFWQNEVIESKERKDTIRLQGIRAPVEILFDDRGVPHIFADNDWDLYFAQGYVTAMDRLWQMEFQTYAARGGLAEIFGHKAVKKDRYMRRIGMVYGANNALKEILNSSETRLAVESYAEGVNAYIRKLGEGGYPVEYKLLDYSPKDWTPLNSALVLKLMSMRLSTRNFELPMDNLLNRFGEEIVADLFPLYSDQVDPIIPTGKAWDFIPKKVLRPNRQLKSGQYRLVPETAKGSNNWAVSGSKTLSGYPILANDPHLDLSLPSVWYEVQLVSPSVNVYGASLPGVPGAIIGFNKNISWGLTNAATDVLDWYEIKFNDESLEEYHYDNEVRTIEKIVEQINVRGEHAVLDTVFYTHHGPVVWDLSYQPSDKTIPKLHALRWLGHDASNELKTVYMINRARNYKDFERALPYFACPAQNFVFADVRGNIAIWHNGKFPLRWRGQGMFIGDGSDPLYEWQDWIPDEQKPHVINPETGFVSSTNQNPTDSSYPYYLTGNYVSYYRGNRINEVLSKTKEIQPDDFRKLQLDCKNLHAESVLPTLLSLIDNQELVSNETTILRSLSAWDFYALADQVAPTIFHVWWRRLNKAIWDDEFGGRGANLRYPSPSRTVRMITNEPNSGWYDNENTKSIEETLAELVNRTFNETCAYLEETLGPMGDSWMWGSYKSTDILHLLKIPGFSHTNLFVGGGWGIVNATMRRSGPTWRMIVALNPRIRAWGIYPGGQSGNPGSPHYDDFIEKWRTGGLYELLFMQTPDDGIGRIEKTLTLVTK